MSTPANPTGDSADDEPQAELPFAKARAAFRLGCYLQLPATDVAQEMLLEVCDGLSLTRVLLLDQALVRLEEFDLAAAEGDRSWPPSVEPWQRRRVVARIRQLAAGLWGGHSELRDWYQAGLSVGRLLVTVFESAPPTANAMLEELINEASSSCRRAAAWSNPPQETERLRQFCLRLSQDFAQSYHARSEPSDLILSSEGCESSDSVSVPVRPLDPETRCMRRLDSIAIGIRDPWQPRPTEDERRKRERDQFLYEAIAIGELTGAALIDEFNRRAREQSWPSIGRPDKYRELASEFARRYGLPPLPARPPGRPRGAP